MNVIIYARDPLIFRDGRPFGEFGTVRTGVLQWPLPSTVGGMLRSRIGLNRDPGFFKQPDAIDRIRSVRIKHTLPVYRTDRKNWRIVYPKPADILVCDGKGGKLELIPFLYASMDGSGITLPWKNWLVPLPQVNEKPARHQPFFWNESIYMSWLTAPEEMDRMINAGDLGMRLPHQDRRIHCSIDRASGVAAEGRLWTSSGLCMQGYDADKGLNQWGIAVELSGCDSDDDITGPAHLGGDRRLAFIQNGTVDWPSCPKNFSNAQYLKLVLTTPGNFGGWAPEWLLPKTALDQNETPWVGVPGLDHKVRLCSAFVPRWIPVSGWDYAQRRPKAMKKLVPAGAVYVIEIQEPANAQSIAGHLWANPLSVGENDGCGICMVGRLNIEESQER